jgi:putative ATP-binding cassette transporter
MSVASDLRVGMYNRISNAPLDALERIGSARLITGLTSDLPRIVLGAQLLPELLTEAVTLLGMLGFLCYLNVDVFWFVLKSILVGVITYQIPVMFAGKYFVLAGKESDTLQESIHGLIQGFKELKLNDEKRLAYFEEILLKNERDLLNAQKIGGTIFSAAASYGQMLCFFAIGAVTFIFVNYHAISDKNLIGVVMALLYITGPIAVILNIVPQIKMARISLSRTTALQNELPDENAQSHETLPPAWDCVRFKKVSYQHRNEDGAAGFKVGDLDLEFRKGEITFIVGGNGSGKSTLSKLLTLHYQPTSGEIYFDDELVSSATINIYRKCIGAIYSDYYLFDRVLAGQQVQERVDHYLRLFDLDQKVTYLNGRFSTLALSDGQRRRMALVAAFLEDKELYLFDEWAADQDPTFKKIFYREILPSLKARGKAVVVITHDDRYFDVADKVLVMADGSIFRTKPEMVEG